MDHDPAHPLQLAQRDAEIVRTHAKLPSQLAECPEQDDAARDRLEDAALCKQQGWQTDAWLLSHAHYNAVRDTAGTITAIEELKRNDRATLRAVTSPPGARRLQCAASGVGAAPNGG